MKAFIAEDEPPARERLVATLQRVAPQVQVIGHADSVQGTAAWLGSHPLPDLLLLDIQLADGLSLELFRDGELAVPTIFTTAYDRFAIEAFRALAVDYLLKPVGDEALAQAVAKAERLRRRFGPDLGEALATVLARWGTAGGGEPIARAGSRFRQRLVGRVGAAFQVLDVHRLAYVVAVDKLACAVAHDGVRLMLDQSLADLAADLDPVRFFRASRQLLVSVDAVQRFASAGKGRLRLELKPPLPGEVQISQERAAAFRDWLGAR